MYRGKKKYVIQTIVIAILYVILTIIADQFGMAKGIVQVRISDALCVLPYFTPAAIPGLFIGCLASNAIISLTPNPMTGGMMLSSAQQYYVILGSCSVMLAAIVSYLIRKSKFIVCVPPIIFNTITVPLLFKFAFRYEDSLLKCFLTVGVGELISCGLLGTALLLALEDSRDKFFPQDDKISTSDKDAITETEDKSDSE